MARCLQPLASLSFSFSLSLFLRLIVPRRKLVRWSCQFPQIGPFLLHFFSFLYANKVSKLRRNGRTPQGTFSLCLFLSFVVARGTLAPSHLLQNCVNFRADQLFIFMAARPSNTSIANERTSLSSIRPSSLHLVSFAIISMDSRKTLTLSKDSF